MKKNKDIALIRVYIIVICIMRTLFLLLAATNGFNIYFPRIHADYNLVLSTIVLIIFWLIAIFLNQ